MSCQTSILFRVDDAGVSPSRNAAIESALRAGVARNVSWMACAPYASEAAELLLKMEGDFCIGLHACINAEWDSHRWGPVAGAGNVASLVQEDGSFFPRTIHLEKRFKIADIETEIRAQIKLAREFGLDLVYLDTHMGFDWLPDVASLLEQIAQEEDLVFNGRCFLKAMPKAAQTAALKHPGDSNIFESMESGQYLWVLHPQDSSRLTHMREEDAGIVAAGGAERQFLTNPILAESLRKAGVFPLTYRDLKMQNCTANRCPRSVL